MKHKFSVLLITDSELKTKFFNFDFNQNCFFPGNRLKNYLELLTGFGIPFDTVDIKDLIPYHLVRKNEIHYSSILFTCPINNLRPEQLYWLEKYSFDYGISLITDAFLFSKKVFFSPFGLNKCSGIRFSRQSIKDKNGKILYKTKPYPYSPKGLDLGFKPLLRCIIQSWFSRKVVFKKTVSIIASFKGAPNNRKPAIVSVPFGKATNYLLNFHPPLVLKDGNLIHSTLRGILETNSNFTSASMYLNNLACLRLDDPGSCERVHLECFNQGVVSKDEWERLIEILKTDNAHLDIAYVPQWVDDGNPEKGTLIHNGSIVNKRIPGKHYNSREIIYSKSDFPNSHKYVSEYQAIKKGVDEGVITILSHGLTHLSINVQAWLKAKNKYTKVEWYREFREMVAGKQKQQKNEELIDRLIKSSELIKQAFGNLPEIIVPAGLEHTLEIPEIAREAGFKIFSGRDTFLLMKDKIISNRKILPFYLENIKYGISFNKAGYPIIPVFHDYDIYRNGTGWLKELISSLKRHGIKRFISMGELGSLLMAKLDVVQEGLNLNVTIDFNNSLKLRNLRGPIPLKIGGTISGLKINDKDYSADFKIYNNFTFLEIPFSEVKSGKITLSATVQSDTQEN